MTDGIEDSARVQPPRRFDLTIGGLIADEEQVVVMARPSLLMVPLAAIGSLLGILVLVVAIILWKRMFPGFGWTVPQAIGFGMILAGARLGWLLLEWMNRLYILTDRRVIRRCGVIRVNVFEARLDRMQQTTVVQSLRERLFGLGTIAFATAGTGAFDAIWAYLPEPYRVHAEVAAAIDRSPARRDQGGV